MAIDRMHYAPPTDLREIAEGLLARLRQLDIEPNVSCELMRARKIVLRLDDELKATGGTEGGDFAQRVHSLLLVRQWGQMLSKGIGSDLEASLREAARVLVEGNPSMHSDGRQSKARDQAFEVYGGCLATQFADEVRFDEKPDLLFRFRGRTIGVACKASYGNDMSKPLRKAREQIAQADCDAGIVLLQLTNQVAHEQLFRCINPAAQEYPVWDPEQALGLFDRMAIAASVPARQVAEEALGGDPKTLGIVAIAEGACITTGTHGPTQITLLHLCQAIGRGGAVDELNEIAKGFGGALNARRV